MVASRVPDRTISQQSSQKLANRGLRSPCQVQVETRNGEVTLSGTVQYAHQKGVASQVVTGIFGVKRVVNQLVVKAAVKRT